MNGARYAYLSRICELVAQGHDIVLVSDDYAAPVLDNFRIEYPDRYISVGIAEQNLIAISCGLAMAGKRVVAYGCAPFPITRAYDQIRNTVAMMRIPINIVVAGIGFAIPEWGATHYNTEDISIMRTIPGMQIITPTDNVMGVAAAEYALENKSPTYIRFDKYSEGDIYSRAYEINFQRGFEVLRDGSDIAVITCGSLTARLLKLADNWNESGISTTIIDLYSLPFNIEKFLITVHNKPILTVEEHILQGGIGSAVFEAVYEYGTENPVQRIGIDFAGAYPQTSGNRDYYLDKYGLSDKSITDTMMKFLNRYKST